ncbi:MAG: hypothetical protein QM538_06695, partial [Methylacidiphilales bacterium]|nr:hypothetical protein [Candidatus Methylacidiphilales bacterium]
METAITLIKELSQANFAVLLLLVYSLHRFKLMEVYKASLDQKLDDKFKNMEDKLDIKFKNIDDKLDDKFKNMDDKFKNMEDKLDIKFKN